MDGFIFVNKPAGPSSFAVVKHIRALSGGGPTGHAGTLDPAAEGLLIVAVGKATRLLEFLPSQPKRYTFAVRFGIETDTLDNQGSVLKDDGRVPSSREIAAALPRFVGRTLQEPPRFSALKINGKRAYHRARNKEAFSLLPREVTIQSLVLKGFNHDEGAAWFEVSCSAGTYIRALARDIARALATVGHARGIRREAIGPFTLESTVDFGAIRAPIEAIAVPIRTVFKTGQCVTIDPTRQKRLAQGMDIALPYEGIGENPVFAFDNDDRVIAVLTQKERGTFHPVKVFIS